MTFIELLHFWRCGRGSSSRQRRKRPLAFEISSIVILPDTHFPNHGNRLDFEMSFLRDENRYLQFLHLNLCAPSRTPHLITSSDPHFGQRWRLLIF